MEEEEEEEANGEESDSDTDVVEDSDEFEEIEDRYSELHSRWVRTTAEEKRQFQEEVGEWRRGRWTADEVKILERNVNAFKKAKKISDLSSFIFSGKHSDHKLFYRSIARDLKRPLFSVYRKMLRVFDISNYVGKWSKENERKLLRLHAVHGNRWTTIGKALGVSGRAAQDKFRSVTKREKKGAWSEEEEAKLVSAVKRLIRETPDESDHSLPPEHSLPTDNSLPLDISWSQVAELVGSRNAGQCRSKWFFELSWKKRGGVKPWDIRDDLKLLRLLSSQEASDEDEVEWAELCTGWASARSPYYLRNKWACLRRSVPSYISKSFEENLDYLLEHRVASLEKKVAATFVEDSD